MTIISEQEQLSEEQWSKLMAEYKASNLSQKSFCELRGIDFKAFTNSRCRIAYRKKQSDSTKNKCFAEVKVTTAVAKKLKLVHPNGIECSLPTSLDEAEILAVIRGLQSC